MEPLSIIMLVLVTVLTAVYGFFKYSFGYWKSKGVPCIEPIIPYGSLKGLGKTVHMMDVIQKSYDKFKPTGAKMCGIYFFTSPVGVLLDVKLMKQIMIKDFEQFNERGLYFNHVDDPLSADLVRVDGEKWKRLRARVTPTFTSGKMKFMFPTILGVGDRFRDCLLEMTKQRDEIEMKDLCSRYTIDVIGTCAFGIECNSLKDPNAEFRVWSRNIISKPRHNALVRKFLNEYRSTGNKLRMKLIPDDIAAFFMKVICDTVEYREKNDIHRNDFMDLLIKLKNEDDADKSITLNELAAQSIIFFLAGFESSSSTLTYSVYELASRPDIQTKARHVIQEAYKKHNGQFTYEMMMDIPYIDQIVEETLRLHPPVPFILRKAQNDYRIPETDIVIDKGTTVFFPSRALHYDPEFYPNPTKFDPDRFSFDEKNKRDMTTWLPFGGGPRNCIGSRFGLLQTKIGLVSLLNSFELSLPPNAKRPLGINMRDSQGTFTTPNDAYVKLTPLKSLIK